MLEKVKSAIDKSVKHLDIEYSKLQLWRANPVIVEWVLIEQYWNMQAIKNLATISNLDSQTLCIKPWDKNIIHAIAKAISDSGLWLNPQTMADSVVIKIPSLTEDRRREVVKIAKSLADEAKIAVRNGRQESLKLIKKAEDDKEISEDIRKDKEGVLQKMIDDANKKIEERFKQKEIEIMKI